MRELVSRLKDLARASPGEVGLIAILGISVLAASLWLFASKPNQDAPPVRKIARASPEAREQLVVHVAGGVVSPGLYRLNAGSRVQDAIEAAGGAAEGADVHALNLAELITDGQKIFVPAAGQSAVADPADPQTGAKLNLNAATAEQLEELPGIGPVLAERIVQFREQEGGFRSVRQLLEIEGIGPKKLEGIEDLLTA